MTGDAVLRVTAGVSGTDAPRTRVRITYAAPPTPAVHLAGPMSAPTQLTDGISVVDYVAPNSVQYYYLTTPASAAMRVVVTVTPYNGDPDLFVALNGAPANRTNYQYMSQSLTGSDTVVVSGNDSAVVQFCSGASCTLQIGVFGWRASNYTLTATSTAGTTSLTPGLPMVADVPANEYNYYAFGVPAGATYVTIQMTPFSGDPDMFVGNSANVGQLRPVAYDPTTYCAYSNWASRDVVEIYADQPCWCAPPCTYYIGVLGFYGAAPSSICAVSPVAPMRVLGAGPPWPAFVGRAPPRQLPSPPTPPPSAPRPVVVPLTPYLGDPDLFVTLDGTTPTASNNAYAASEPSGIDFIAIHFDDPQYLSSPCGPSTLPAGGACQVRIAVVGYTASIYNLVASASRYIQLIDGAQVEDLAPAGGWRYFRFTSSIAAPIVITAVPLSGDPDMFIGSDANATATSVPTNQRGTYFWRSTTLSTEIITIPPTDPNACAPPCSYYIGVTGYRSNATFAISATTRSSTPVPLTMGQPLVRLCWSQRLFACVCLVTPRLHPTPTPTPQ